MATQAQHSAPPDTDHWLPNVPSPLAQSASRAALRLGMHHYFRFQVHGKQHIPARGPAILASNHLSYLDIPILLAGTRRWVHFIGWEGVFGDNAFGRFLRAMGGIPVPHDRVGVHDGLRRAETALAAGRIVAIFFEGKRAKRLGRLEPAQPGAAWLALRTGAPLVPTSIAGMQRIYGRDQWIPRPGPARLVYHPAIDPASFAPDRPLNERVAMLTESIAHTVASAVPPDGRHR